ncbi:MAG: DUF4159 domain-containing protein [Calditrichaeota bacterium]|nr:DUF4159 domain-containing protein [Calditrichota bacterium]RQV99851.1 MAG: DUF4159 domain-containing protein [Calditrichota bacterium]
MKRIVLLLLIFFSTLSAQNPVTVARIKYSGGGDWYGNRTTFVNLFNYMRQTTGLELAEREQSVEVMDRNFFKYPISYIAGHGNIKFSPEEINRLRIYLTSGGFLWADDDYGMDFSFRREMAKVFPGLEWVKLPFSHPIFHIKFEFPNGLPKIHKHDGGPPKALGLFYEGRMVAFYSLNTDISDGCEDADIHKDPPEVRERALQMGTNIILWALTHLK